MGWQYYNAKQNVSQLQDEVADAKKLAGPRNFTEKDGSNIEVAAEAFRGTPYDLSLPPLAGAMYKRQLLELEPDSYFVNHLIPILASAGWQLRSVQGDVPKVLLPPSQTYSSLSVAHHLAGLADIAELLGQFQ